MAKQNYRQHLETHGYCKLLIVQPPHQLFLFLIEDVIHLARVHEDQHVATTHKSFQWSDHVGLLLCLLSRHIHTVCIDFQLAQEHMEGKYVIEGGP